MIELRWTKQAVEDLAAIRNFIERDSPRYGRIVVQGLIHATERIVEFPRSGRIVPELERDEIREVIAGSYRIVYRIHGEVVEIVTVFRSSKLFPISDFQNNEP